ncbi:hypothetical protein BHF71_05770 [Vulcanibacillus modesticaldus]|uniref:CARDB domain-containing protein n=1 Tax=Vulcanibacillus modesticaldus TaxID=337097 RepID=A0A1D2YWQ9_9BACI|nr:CARDB domain-containing protein [Vulcanibacillus modesticaldus]OEG00195.1 hypothetical protein BHF71_05770 [Vulcanibacillus modesticaldus]
MRIRYKRGINILLSLILVFSIFPLPKETLAYSLEAQKIIDYYGIATTNANGKTLNEKYLLDQMGVGEALVVYGTPEEVPGNEKKNGQWRYFGYDVNGNPYWNIDFPNDALAEPSVAKNWIKQPWNLSSSINETIKDYLTDPNYTTWLASMVDTYNNPTSNWLDSYNALTGSNWTANTLKDYAIMTQRPYDFAPGYVTMWNSSGGKWWYETFYIPPEKKIDINNIPTEPDLEITQINYPDAAYTNENITINVTVKNNGDVDSGLFQVGLFGVTVSSKSVTNLAPGATKTLTFNFSFSSTGLKNLSAKVDINGEVVESNEDNNVYPFAIYLNKKNEPTTPIAIISHLQGDTRTVSTITVQTGTDLKLDDSLSYDPGGELITEKYWRYKEDKIGSQYIYQKPNNEDITSIDNKSYFIELYVKNKSGKESGWIQLKVNVSDPPPPPAELKADISFNPDRIIIGEGSQIFNMSDGLDSYSWTFSPELEPYIIDKNAFEPKTNAIGVPGTYSATIKVMKNDGSSRTDTAYLRVIDPKPIAIITGVNKITQGRDFPNQYHLLNSYSPIADRGVTINHTYDKFRWKKSTDSSYTNGLPTKAPNDPGIYYIEGQVTDSDGRVSDWGRLELEVVEDKAPIVNLFTANQTYRNIENTLYIEATSPDFDKLNRLVISYQYDSDNDGSYSDEAWNTVYDGPFTNVYKITHSTVGKRKYEAIVYEEYGKGTSATTVIDVINKQPTVNFNTFGLTSQPKQDSEAPIISYSSDTIFNSWTLKSPYVGGDLSKIGWKNSNGTLSTKNAVKVDFSTFYPDMGNGPNGRTNQTIGNLELLGTWTYNGTIIKKVFPGHRVYSYQYNSTTGNYDFFERNAKTGEIISSFSVPRVINGYTNEFITIGDDDEVFYFTKRSTVDSNTKLENLYLVSFDNKGNFIEEVLIGQYFVPLVQDIYFDKDKDTLYLIMLTRPNYVDYRNFDVQLAVVKYSKSKKMTYWSALDYVYGNRRRLYNFKLVKDYNDDVYVIYLHKDFYQSGFSYYVSFRLIKINNNTGIIEASRNNYDAEDVTYPVFSNDNKYVYVSFVDFYKSGGKYYRKFYIETLNTVDLSVKRQEYLYGVRSSSKMYAGESIPLTNPIVLSNGRVYVIYERNSKYAILDYNGNVLSKGAYIKSPSWGGSTTQDRTLPNTYLQSNGKGLMVRMSFDSYSDPNYYKYVWVIHNIINREILKEIVYKTVPRGGGSSSPQSELKLLWFPDNSLYYFGENLYTKEVSVVGEQNSATYPKVIDSNTIEVIDDNWGGLFYDINDISSNYSFEFDVSVNDLKNDKVIGAGFNIQDEKNLYSIEWSKNTLTLYRVINGTKTVLGSVSLNRTPFSNYHVKIDSYNGNIKILINDIKYMDVNDSTYIDGSVGIMSLGQSNVSFNNIKRTAIVEYETQPTYGAVLVDETVNYETMFTDPENDSKYAESWSYVHYPNFFENSEGYSVYHNKTYSSPITVFDKPGKYEIYYKAQDNPGLAGYGLWSEEVMKELYVHRRPIAQPDIRFTGKVYVEGESLDYDTYDTSYDPDLTLITDKEFRWKYSDETTWKYGKKQYYDRPGVTLIIQERVKDIHGAWSYWAEQRIYKNNLPPVNQRKPTMTITSPNGTSANPTVVSSEPLVKWNYYDQDGDLQERYKLEFYYNDSNELALQIEHWNANKQYQVSIR